MMSSFAYRSLIQAFLAADLTELEKRQIGRLPLKPINLVEAQFLASD
jgi:hypothetical protein